MGIKRWVFDGILDVVEDGIVKQNRFQKCLIRILNPKVYSITGLIGSDSKQSNPEL